MSALGKLSSGQPGLPLATALGGLELVGAKGRQQFVARQAVLLLNSLRKRATIEHVIASNWMEGSERSSRGWTDPDLVT